MGGETGMTRELDQITPEEVTSAILSYSDPGLVTSLFNQLGWCPSAEIVETLYIARQNVNLAAKLSAIKYLRQLVRESAEAAGLIGTVSKTIHGKDGSHTTFSARNMATVLNPERKSVIAKEITNVEQRTEGQNNNSGSLGKSDNIGQRSEREGTVGTKETGQGADTGDTGNKPCGGTDRGRDRGAGVGGSPVGDQDIESGNSAEGSNTGSIPTSEIFGAPGDDSGATEDRDEYKQPPREGATDNPCVEHRPPTCNQDLYPGVSGTPKEDGKMS